MVQYALEQLKSDAFKLARILATYKVKLSSQQCLDVLSRLRWDMPYEAVVTKGSASSGGQRPAAAREEQTLSEWLSCSQSFCDLVKTLDREGVDGAAWNGHKVPEGLHWDGKTYLRAAGIAAERFSRTAEAFILDLDSKLYEDLTFSVEVDDPIVSGQLATLRIQSLGKPGRKATTQNRFVPFGLEQRYGEPILFGAEARISLLTLMPEYGDKPAPYQMVPAVEFSYEVTGQQALKVFADALEASLVQKVWEAVGGLDVETRILLTNDNTQDAIDEDWATGEDPEGKRLLKFCRKASRLSNDETCDWPPYLRLYRRLDHSNNQLDLELIFAAICAHALCMRGPSGGWHEIFENWRTAGFS